MKPTSTSHIVKNRTELNSISSDVEDLWIGRFDTSGITDFSLSSIQSLKSLVIGNHSFWSATSFVLNNLPQLQSVKLDCYAFWYVHSVVFESDGMDGLMIQICPKYNSFNFVHLLLMVMSVMVERRLSIRPSTSRIH